jgi:phosphohistidine phosphatase
MRRLFLLRHGEAEWPDGVDDVDRPLASRGRDAARRLGLYLAAEGLRPDLVLVSPARRAQETWNLVRAPLGTVTARTEARIYAAPAEALLALVKQVDRAVNALLMVGHNPGLHDLLQALASPGDRRAAMSGFPAGGLAVIDLPASAWPEVLPRSGVLDRFVTPASLGGGSGE